MDQPLPKLALVDAIDKALDDTPRAELIGLWGAGKALAAVQIAQARGASLLYVSPGRIEAEAAFEDLCTFAGEGRCALLPAWEVLPTDTMEPTDDIIAERMNALSAIAAAQANNQPIYVSVSARSFLQRVVDRDRLLEDSITLSLGEEHDLEDIAQRLIDMGYERELMVEQRGELSVRGGIFDVFPISAALPFRIEFFGDEIESIRRFEPETNWDGTSALRGRYKELLRAYVIMGSGGLSSDLTSLACRLVCERVTASQTVRMHLDVLEEMVDGLGSRSGRHVLNRANLLLTEMLLSIDSQAVDRRDPEDRTPVDAA